MTGTDFVTLDEVNDLVARLHQQWSNETAQAIAMSLRMAQPRNRTAPSGISASFGTVIAAYDGYADVLLDTDADTASVSTLGTPAVGDRGLVIFLPPAGGFLLGSASSGGAVSSGAGSPVALWELPGPVIPVAQIDSPAIPVVVNGTVGGVTLALEEAPLTGLTCVVDVFLNGTTLFPTTKPTLIEGQTLIHVALAAPVDVVAFVDVVTAAVITPAGRTLTIALS